VFGAGDKSAPVRTLGGPRDDHDETRRGPVA
jgi:hypothetical protein